MPTDTHRLSIHWFRRDLRLSDNTALSRAVASSEQIIPLYILSDWEGSHSWTGPGRQQFLCQCLQSLAGNLEALGSRLIIRRGEATEVIAELLEAHAIEAVFLNQDPDPYGKAVEDKLQKLCSRRGVNFSSHLDVSLHAAKDTRKADDSPYRVYTPYSRNWLKLDKPAMAKRPDTIKTPAQIPSDPLPSLETWQLALPSNHEFLTGGEKAAHSRLKQALAQRLANYHQERDIPSLESTSRLSQDLRWGTISIRKVFYAAQKQEQAAESPAEQESYQTYIKELAWRDFYLHLLDAFPKVLEKEFNSDYENLPWEEPGEGFEAWKNGQTGFPIVDAGMRQLVHTGFMHNRVRMIVAMFLTKDLRCDWRLGEQFFAQHLLDGEIASNNGGWQWSAGTGADAAPYFRIQNPWTQSKRFDGQGDYIRHWVPELADVPHKNLHQAPTGSSLATGYPLPILDHGNERAKTLEVFKTHLDQVRGRA